MSNSWTSVPFTHRHKRQWYSQGSRIIWMWISGLCSHQRWSMHRHWPQRTQMSSLLKGNSILCSALCGVLALGQLQDHWFWDCHISAPKVLDKQSGRKPGRFPSGGWLNFSEFHWNRHDHTTRQTTKAGYISHNFSKCKCFAFQHTKHLHSQATGLVSETINRNKEVTENIDIPINTKFTATPPKFSA